MSEQPIACKKTDLEELGNNVFFEQSCRDFFNKEHKLFIDDIRTCTTLMNDILNTSLKDEIVTYNMIEDYGYDGMYNAACLEEWGYIIVEENPMNKNEGIVSISKKFADNILLLVAENDAFAKCNHDPNSKIQIVMRL